MRVLTDNKCKLATLTSLNADPNYPLSNVIHRYLTKVYRTTASTTDTITIEFDDLQDIDCIVVDYNNLSALTAKLYSGASVLLDTQVLTPSDIMHYFTQVDDVKTIELELTTIASYIEIGGISAGLKVDMPSSKASFKKIIGDRSRGNKTEGGQLNGRKIKKLQGYTFTIPVALISDIDIIENIINDVQKVNNFWFDLFEDSHATYLPFYASFTAIREATRSSKGLGYNFSFSVEESF